MKHPSVNISVAILFVSQQMTTSSTFATIAMPLRVLPLPSHPSNQVSPPSPVHVNLNSCTPLHYAAGAGDVDLCKRLIEKGAKVNTWDSYQFTAVDYAKQSGATDCVTYLEQASTPGATTAGEAQAANSFSLLFLPTSLPYSFKGLGIPWSSAAAEHLPIF